MSKWMLAMLFSSRTPRLVDPGEALPGRDQQMEVPERHFVLDAPLRPPFPEDVSTAVFAMGCFWGAERIFWEAPGVYTTAVGYTGGHTPNPTYEEVCSERTGHAEAVLVAFHPADTTYEHMLRLFWENHDPTQRHRQGNDVGTQYRSAIYFHDQTQRSLAESSREAYQRMLTAAGHAEIATHIAPLGPFYYAEPYHQQYLAKNPGAYCGAGGTGIACPTSVGLRPVTDTHTSD